MLYYEMLGIVNNKEIETEREREGGKHGTYVGR